jgi:hypothetical protein
VIDVQKTLLHYLNQLTTIVEKVPEALFSTALTEETFSLEMHAKIAANFTLRGYCPLVNIEMPDLFEQQGGREHVLKQIQATIAFLTKLDPIERFNDHNMLSDKAGFTEVTLPESEFITLYIIPNTLFHMTTVYAIARAQGVALSKGDFDGLHHYPKNFSFVK